MMYGRLRTVLGTPLAEARQTVLDAGTVNRATELKKFSTSESAVAETLRRISATDPALALLLDNIKFVDQGKALVGKL